MVIKGKQGDTFGVDKVTITQFIIGFSLPRGCSFLFTTKSTQGISLINAGKEQPAIRLKTEPKKRSPKSQ
jgi:hypothetical protein